MPVIDADSHVVETERTWTFMPDEQEEYRPAVLARKSGRTRASEYWLIDDRVFAKNVEGFNAADAGKIDVHEDHIRLFGARKLNALKSVSGSQQADIGTARDDLLVEHSQRLILRNAPGQF